MHRSTTLGLAILGFILPHSNLLAQPTPTDIGLFESHGDVGVVRRPGSATFDAASRTYQVAGGGENMWFATDAFHYVWKRVSGDVSLAADIRWIGTGGNAHRKACLLIRQTLDADSSYADAVVHGDGLTSLQYRELKGGPTREIQANVSAPFRIRIEKQGDYVSMSLALAGESLRPAGGSFRIQFQEPFYIGLAVCAHDHNALEQAIFSNVELANLAARTWPRLVLESTLETVPIASKDRRVVHHTRGRIEAPNWSRDGKFLLFNQRGRIYRLPVEGGEPRQVDTGFAVQCSNHHGISPDGTQLAISDQTEEGKSLIYLLPLEGGTPRRITKLGPSYWHGWAPDGKTLVYTGERAGEFDIYSLPATGGDEKRLILSPGRDDGPEYSPDGQFIYFSSERSGTTQIWKMRADGSQPEQLTKGDDKNLFPHPSPDGRWIAFLTYEKSVKGHPRDKDVMLRLLPTGGGEIQVLAKLLGGEGTIDAPSWSPDSRRLAFVSYRLVSP